MMTKEEVREAAKNIRLIAVDMDGTSLTTKKEFTPRTHKAMQALIDRGILIVPATGRGSRGLAEKVMNLQGVRYVISADGAYVTDCGDDSRLWEQRIPCAVAAALADELLKEGNCVYFHCPDLTCTHVMACNSREEYRRLFWRPGFQKPEEIITENFGSYILEQGQDVAKLGMFFSRPDGFEVYEPLISEKYPGVNCFRSDSNVLEMTSCHTSKGEALRALSGHLGLSREQVCAIGDNGNDIGMLEYAGVGVAMGNAIDAARQKADYVALTNDEEGVADFLEAFFGNNTIKQEN